MRKYSETKREIRDDYDFARTKYFSDFALRYKNEMKILREGGVLGKDGGEWRNVSAHCLLEAVGADVLAEALQLDSETRDKVVKAAVLHDWYKRKEIEAMKQMGGGECHKQTIKEDKDRLDHLGIPSEVVHLTEAIIPQSADEEYLNNRSIGEKIIHYIDAITDNVDFVPVQERMEKARNRSQLSIDFSDSFKEVYGGKNLHELQIDIATNEGAEFKRLLGLSDDEDLLQFIRDKIRLRIEQYKK